MPYKLSQFGRVRPTHHLGTVRSAEMVRGTHPTLTKAKKQK